MEDSKDETLNTYNVSDPSYLLKPVDKLRRSMVMVSQSNATNITPVDMQKMLELGINALKINIPFTTKGDKMRLLAMLDKACVKCSKKNGVPDWPVASCIELKTCVVRTGLLKSAEDTISIHEGSHVILTNNPADYHSCIENKIFVDNACLTTEAKVGTEISIGEGEIILHCTEIIDNKSIQCIVSHGGQLFDIDFVSMRGTKQERPTLCKSDFKIIKFALEYQIDMLIINYVRNAETLRLIKKFIGNKVKRPYLISGLSTQQGLDNIDDIMEESDAILLSREFLPFELDASKRFRMYHIQKWLGAKCQSFGKPFFLSGNVLEDTLTCGVYTGREVSDISNALFDGVCGFILRSSSEIDYVLAAVENMNKICQSIEPYIESKARFYRVIDEIKMPLNAAEAAMISCVSVAYQCGARAIIIPTVTGVTARHLLRMSPPCIVITVTTQSKVNRLLQSCKSVKPLLYVGNVPTKFHLNMEAKIDFAVGYAVYQKWLAQGDKYVSLQRGTEESSFNDMVRIWPVTKYKKPTVECHYNSDDSADSNESTISRTIVQTKDLQTK